MSKSINDLRRNLTESTIYQLRKQNPSVKGSSATFYAIESMDLTKPIPVWTPLYPTSTASTLVSGVGNPSFYETAKAAMFDMRFTIKMNKKDYLNNKTNKSHRYRVVEVIKTVVLLPEDDSAIPKNWNQ